MKKLILLFLMTPAFAQQPKLSTTTQIAVSALQDRAKGIQDQITQFQQLIAGLDRDIRAQYPGFHFDSATLQVVSDSVDSPATPGVKPAPLPQPSPAPSKPSKK